MIEKPHTKEEASRYRYGTWAGNPRGRAYNPERCAYEVYSNDRSMMFYQCHRKNGHGPEGIYCKQHAKRFKLEAA